MTIRTAPGLTRQLLILTLGRLLQSSALRLTYPFLPAFARGLGVPLQAVTQLVALRAFAGFLSPILAPLAERFGRRASLAGSMLVFGLALLLLLVWPAYWALAVALIAIGVTKVVYDPALQAYLGDTVPYRQRGVALALSETSWAGAMLLGAPLGLPDCQTGLGGAVRLAGLSIAADGLAHLEADARRRRRRGADPTFRAAPGVPPPPRHLVCRALHAADHGSQRAVLHRLRRLDGRAVWVGAGEPGAGYGGSRRGGDCRRAGCRRCGGPLWEAACHHHHRRAHRPGVSAGSLYQPQACPGADHPLFVFLVFEITVVGGAR